MFSKNIIFKNSLQPTHQFAPKAFYSPNKLFEIGFGKCQVAKRPWLWHVASPISLYNILKLQNAPHPRQ